MKYVYKLLAWIFGQNPSAAPIEMIIEQMHEPRPLPLGMTEFDEWSDRIISGALITAEPDSQKFALASMLNMMGPTEDHKEDVFFIKSLRRSAIAQIAQAKQNELKEKAKARLATQDDTAAVVQ